MTLGSRENRVVVSDYREVVVEGWGRPGSREVREAPWIRVLLLHLDEGEAEAIAPALEVNASLILLDDREARLHAKRLGLRVTGTLGILLRAKRHGLIESRASGRD